MKRYSVKIDNFRHSGGIESFNEKCFSEKQNKAAVLIVIFSVIYNAILAALAARDVYVGYATVASVEIALIFLCFSLCLSTGLSFTDVKPISLVWFVALLALLLSIKFETFFVASIRNFLIIAAFCMLGQRMDERHVRLAFFATSLVALAVLIWEISFLESYARFFSPAHYYELTRGTPSSEYDSSGLSVGTVTFEGRFSFGIFSGRRTSSIFLEQVGINAYAIVCMAFLNALWSRLSFKERALQIITIALIVTSNNARMASLMCLFMPMGYFIFPLLSRFWIIPIPFLIISGIFLLSPMLLEAEYDDLLGRLAVTYRLLNVVQVSDLLFGNPLLVSRAYDTGYGYVIASVGFFGGMAFLSYLISYPRFNNFEQRRGSWSVAIYILLWLTVGGTGVFSIKTASLMWMLVGMISYRMRSLESSQCASSPT